MPNGVCPEEQETQHHGGAGGGFGPVRDPEIVLFAVFEKTPRSGLGLTQESFRNNQLRRGEVSVARMPYTGPDEFQQRVVQPGENEQGQFLAVCCTNAKAIRDITVKLEPDKPASAVRGICVIDKVTPVDFDGHAALKYAELPGPISDGRLGRLRTLVREDLARCFGSMTSLDEAYTCS